ncbi:hypothetical protein [Leptolyngbya sp. FACHB-16]|uniref:hypothetical protein n=1 Tax=unclassified Leptolyngbya TaxID=2650499 RepID=UPI0016895091|nr:hypothetical protein [Leptolyngbya sp. FACHB-16]MBD2155619.1 hypothetical protein [Leptolyngbya sp. FACHB-16]
MSTVPPALPQPGEPGHPFILTPDMVERLYQSSSAHVEPVLVVDEQENEGADLNVVVEFFFGHTIPSLNPSTAAGGLLVDLL